MSDERMPAYTKSNMNNAIIGEKTVHAEFERYFFNLFRGYGWIECALVAARDKSFIKR